MADVKTAAPKVAKPKDATPIIVTGVASLPQPERTNRRGNGSAFPFASLVAVGQCFGVKNRTAKSLSQIISTQNRKNTTDKRDENGNVVYKTKKVKSAEGVETVMPSNEPEKVPTKHFYAFDVTKEYAEQHLKGTDLEGSSVLVFRDI